MSLSVWRGRGMTKKIKKSKQKSSFVDWLKSVKIKPIVA